MTTTQKENKALCDLYPFLILRNVWTDEIFEDEDYSFTQLDNLPVGWRKAFGEEMCRELKEALGDEVSDWRIFQLKEKYGMMRLYSNWTTDKVDVVIRKYEDISLEICEFCGSRAEYSPKGWECPICEKCARAFKRIKFPEGFRKLGSREE